MGSVAPLGARLCLVRVFFANPGGLKMNLQALRERLADILDPKARKLAKVETTTVFLHDTTPWVKIGVQLVCGVCGCHRAVLCAVHRLRFIPYPEISWVLPRGWHRVTVDGKESLVCDQHDCLARRPHG